MNLHTGKTLSNQESLNQSINLILLTPKGERVLNRDFGSNVINYLGQPINNVVMEITAEVISSLQSNDTRLQVDSVSIQNQNPQQFKNFPQGNKLGSGEQSEANNSGLALSINYNGGEQTTLQSLNSSVAKNLMLMSEARKNVLT